MIGRTGLPARTLRNESSPHPPSSTCSHNPHLPHLQPCPTSSKPARRSSLSAGKYILLTSLFPLLIEVVASHRLPPLVAKLTFLPAIPIDA